MSFHVNLGTQDDHAPVSREHCHAEKGASDQTRDRGSLLAGEAITQSKPEKKGTKKRLREFLLTSLL